MIKLPQNRIWNQENRSDLLGSLYTTKNINLEQDGYIGLSKRMSYLLKNGTNFGYPSSIQFFQGLGYLSVGSRSSVPDKGQNYIVDTTFTSITADTATNSDMGMIGSDCISFNSTIYLTGKQTNASLFKRSGGNWSTIASINGGSGIFTNQRVHPMAVFEKSNYLAIGDANKIYLMNTGETLATTVVLPAEFEVMCLAYLNNTLYIGTTSVNGNKGRMFTWGSSPAGTTADNSYEIYGTALTSLCVHKSTIFGINSEGQLLYFDGGGLKEIARFPAVNYQEEDFIINGPNSGYTFTTNHRSMFSVGDYLYIGVANTTAVGGNDIQIVKNMYGGIWAWNDKYGLHHKFSPSITQANSQPLNDYCQLINQEPTTLCWLTRLYRASVLPDASLGARFLCGNELLQEDSTDVNNSADFYLTSITTGINVGSFETPKIIFDNQVDYVRKLYLKYKPFENSTDEIRVKYKIEDKVNFPYVQTIAGTNQQYITWTNSTTFTTVDTIFDNVEVDYEVEILSGNGGGQTAHILSIIENLGVYTVVLKEEVVGITNGNIGFIKIDNYKLLETVDSDSVGEVDNQIEIPLMDIGKSIQFKIEMKGENIFIENLYIVNDSSRKTV